MKNELVEEFEKNHGISIPVDFENGEKVIEAFLKLHSKLRITMGGLQEDDFHKSPSIGVIFQLINRIHEQLSGSLISICTKNHASSEILSRTAIESAVSVLYFFKDDTESKVLVWLKKYIEEDKRHIQDWEKSLKTQDEQQIHAPRILARRESSQFKEKFVDQYIYEIKQILQIDDSLRLPQKIFKKFQDIGEETTYHTVYTRLSAMTHLNAEDTISYMIAKVYGNKKQQQQMGLEHHAFSEYMCHYAILFYARTIEEFCIKYTNQQVSEIESIKGDILSIMTRLGEKWEW